MALKTLKLKRLPILLFLSLFLVLSNPLRAGTDMLKTKEVIVTFEGPIENVAKEVVKAYPTVKAELVTTLKWEIKFRPEVVLVKDGDALRSMVGSDIIVAFAVPDRNLIVVDTSRVYTKPFTLEATLKHELCHILLHRNLKKERLPKWLDEGVCQWVSGGIAELMVDRGDRVIAKATLSDRLIGIRELRRFPLDERSLILAYEESKSIVEYIVNEFGEQRFLQVLEYLKEGHSIDDSINKSLSMSIPELEQKWHTYLKRKHTWVSYLSHNLYIILFSLAAVVTVYGFILLMKRKKAYVDEGEDIERRN